QRAANFFGEIANQFFDEIRHFFEIGVGPICFKHREFWIVFSRDAFVPEVAIDFEYLVESSYEQTFQIKLQRNAQIEIDSECVVARFEGLGCSTSGYRL